MTYIVEFRASFRFAPLDEVAMIKRRAMVQSFAKLAADHIEPGQSYRIRTQSVSVPDGDWYFIVYADDGVPELRSHAISITP